jgi:hypothetical protein
MKRFIAPISIIFMVSMTVWFLKPSSKAVMPGTKMDGKKRQPRPLPALNLPAPKPMTSSPGSLGRAKKEIRSPTTPLQDIRAGGVLGQDKKWLSSVMDRTDWQRANSDDVWTYVNTNQVQMTFQILASRVHGISIVFPPKALSADLSVISSFLVGERGRLPLHWEAFRRPVKPKKVGQFRHPDGRSIYYRGELRTTGEPPFGPKFIELSATPFEGQPPFIEKHVDESMLPGLMKPVK